MTQQQLADAADMERTHVSRIEMSKFNVQLDTLVVLAQGLQITPAELFKVFGMSTVPPQKRKPDPLG